MARATGKSVGEARRFEAYATQDARHMTHPVPDAANFLEAAVLFAERWTHASSGEAEVSVTVVDRDTGERHCFRIDLDSEEARPC